MIVRKSWSQEEDKILIYLKEDKGERKWSTIAKMMDLEFNIIGRTGKQCRQRYHNHLDAHIINSEWTAQEEQILIKLHDKIGNKWSLISHKLVGRTDNSVKNHFYSKLRKSLRKLNKIISQSNSKLYRQIKPSILYKIIQVGEQRFKTNSKVDEDLVESSVALKNKLFYMENYKCQNSFEAEKYQNKLINQIDKLDQAINKKGKLKKEGNFALETDKYFESSSKQDQKQTIQPQKHKNLTFLELFRKVYEEISLQQV